jgi:protein TonB
MKRLGIAAVLAVAVHVGLFAVDLPSTPPVLPAARKRAVSLNLVSTQKIAVLPVAASVAARPQPPPKAAPKPLPKRIKRPQVKVSPRVKPYTPPMLAKAAIEPLTPLANVEPAREPVAPSPSTETMDKAPARPPDADPGAEVAGDSEPVTMAVPLYRNHATHGYPALARRRQYEGTVILEVLVGTDGRVMDLRVNRSSGHGILDRSAAKDVKQWRFMPARKGGRAVEMWVKVPVRYELN